MKVLYIIDGVRKGGKERRFLELIRNLESSGSITYQIVMFHTEIEYYIDNIIRKKIIYVRKNNRKSIRPFCDIIRIVWRFQPDIIHTWSSMVTFYSLPSIILTKAKLVNSQVSDAPNLRDTTIFFRLITFTNFAFSSTVVSNSNSGLDSYRLNTSKAKCVYNGFDFRRLASIDSIDIVKKKYLIKTDYVIGMVATFSASKDYTTFLKAAQILLQVNSNITFLCIGGGDDSKFKKFVSDNMLSNVLFLGKCDNVESIMNVCNIGILSTFTEGISNALLEFCALGIPVIASNCRGNAEIVLDSHNGFLFEQGNIFELAYKINILINDATLRQEMGANGVEMVKNKFGIDRMVNEFQEIYAALI
jgi:glycosyltransferase involved in cell wall biosynthesis